MSVVTRLATHPNTSVDKKMGGYLPLSGNQSINHSETMLGRQPHDIIVQTKA